MTGRAEMAQKGFVKELVRTYGHNGARSELQGSRETMIHLDEEERALIDAEPVDTTGKEGVIEAQRRVGELLWLMAAKVQDRCRPKVVSEKMPTCMWVREESHKQLRAWEAERLYQAAAGVRARS